jgi:peptidoglycan hydrolase-like protein with peptidoglycan-binding domain
MSSPPPEGSTQETAPAPAGADPVTGEVDLGGLGEVEAVPLLRRRPVQVAGVCALVLVAVVATYLTTRSSSSSSATTVQRSTALVAVTRRDLVETASFDGTVDYADQRDVAAVSLSSSTGSASSGSSGVVTSVARVGTVVRRGGTLFSVNSQPTVLMYGSYPAYRTLSSGVASGPDVKQLQENLKALGYASSYLEPSESWNSATTTAVYRWEADLGLTQDGTVPLGRVVFAKGPVRISSAATLGDSVSATSSVVTIASTRREATVDLTASDAAVVGVGNRVTVTLPSGETVPGRVSTVGTVATSSSSTTSSSQGGAVNQSGGSSATSDATIQVTVSLASARGLGSLATAPVTVAFAQRRARNVLAVPTTALLTLADGTFGVEVSRGESTQLVRVTPGLFAAGGFVAVKGAVKEGDKVVVPK